MDATTPFPWFRKKRTAMAANILMMSFFPWFRKKRKAMTLRILIMMIDKWLDQGDALVPVTHGLGDTRKHVRTPFESWLLVRGTNPSINTSVRRIAILSRVRQQWSHGVVGLSPGEQQRRCGDAVRVATPPFVKRLGEV